MILWVILGTPQNHLRITGIDHLARPVVLENDLKIHIFLAVASAVAVAAAVVSRFKDPAHVLNYFYNLLIVLKTGIWNVYNFKNLY